MGIPLPLLALYAFSAKKKGDKIRASAAAEAQAEVQKAKLENQMGTLYQLPDGRMLPVGDGSPMILPEGAKAVKYGKLLDLTYDFPEQAVSMDVVRIPQDDGTYQIGTRDQFTFEQLIRAEPYGKFVGGKYEAPPAAAFGSKTPPVATEKNQIYAMHPNAPSAYIGDAAGYYPWLTENKISDNDANLIVFDQIVKSLGDGKTDITSSTKRDISSNPVTRDDTRYIYNNEKGEQVVAYASDGDINVSDLNTYGGIIETGNVGPDGTFNVTSSKTVSPKSDGGASETQALADAINVAEFDIALRFGVDGKQKIGLNLDDSTKTATARMRSLLTQLSDPNNQGALLKIKDNPNATDVNTFKDGVFSLMSEVWNQTDETISQSTRTYRSYRTMEDLVTDQFQSLLLIPGMKEKIDSFDEGYRQKTREDIKNANTTPNQSAETVIVEQPIPDEVVIPELGKKLEIAFPVTWDNKYDKLIYKSLLPRLETNLPLDRDTNVGPRDASLMALERNFIQYETDFMGRIIRDENGLRKAKADQPVLTFLNELQENGEMDNMIRLMTAKTSPADTLSDFDTDYIVRFMEATDGDLAATTGVVASLMPSNKGAIFDMMKRYQLKNETAQSKYEEGQKAVADAARRGLAIVDQAISTYNPDPVTGEPRAGTTLEAEISLFAEGIEYFVGKGRELAGVDVKNLITNSSNKLASRAQGLAGEKYVQSAEGRNLLEEEFKKAVQNEQYAQRAFFTLVLAYEVAAAIQGGTGGRTISDQDVALIFRGLRQNWSDSPRAQVAALRAVKGMLTRFELRARMLSSGDRRSIAAYLTAENFAIRAGQNIDGMFAVPYIYEEFGGDALPDGTEKGADNYFGLTEEKYNEMLLKTINESRQAGGKPPYGSIKEAEKDNPQYFNTQKQKQNIRLGSKQ